MSAPTLSAEDAAIVRRLVPHRDVEWRDPETGRCYYVIADDGGWIVSTLGWGNLVEIAYALEPVA